MSVENGRSMVGEEKIYSFVCEGEQVKLLLRDERGKFRVVDCERKESGVLSVGRSIVFQSETADIMG